MAIVNNLHDAEKFIRMPKLYSIQEQKEVVAWLEHEEAVSRSGGLIEYADRVRESISAAYTAFKPRRNGKVPALRNYSGRLVK